MKTTTDLKLVLALLENFAGLVSLHMLGAGLARGDCAANLRRTGTRVVMGRRYAKVDVGRGDLGEGQTPDWSGRYMVDLQTLAIVDIKAYGIPNLGHRYGDLTTVGEYDWSGYTGQRKPSEVLRRELDEAIDLLVTRSPEAAALN